MTIEITDEMRKVAGDAVHDHLYDKPAPDYASPTGDDFQDIGLAALTAALPIIEKQVRAAWAEEIRAIEIPEHNLHDQMPSDHWYAGQKIMRDEIAALLEGGAE